LPASIGDPSAHAGRQVILGYTKRSNTSFPHARPVMISSISTPRSRPSRYQGWDCGRPRRKTTARWAMRGVEDKTRTDVRSGCVYLDPCVWGSAPINKLGLWFFCEVGEPLVIGAEKRRYAPWIGTGARHGEALACMDLTHVLERRQVLLGGSC
jgi:hypothetical protein